MKINNLILLVLLIIALVSMSGCPVQIDGLAYKAFGQERAKENLPVKYTCTSVDYYYGEWEKKCSRECPADYDFAKCEEKGMTGTEEDAEAKQKPGVLDVGRELTEYRSVCEKVGQYETECSENASCGEDEVVNSDRCAVCGDGFCDKEMREDSENCSEDCEAPSTHAAYCGDGICQESLLAAVGAYSENQRNCCIDCGCWDEFECEDNACTEIAGCEPLTCTLYCEHGYKVDGEGCEICECVEVECEEGEIKYYECPDGEEVEWCDCVQGKWHCIKSPENQCIETEYFSCDEAAGSPQRIYHDGVVNNVEYVELKQIDDSLVQVIFKIDEIGEAGGAIQFISLEGVWIWFGFNGEEFNMNLEQDGEFTALFKYFSEEELYAIGIFSRDQIGTEKFEWKSEASEEKQQFKFKNNLDIPQFKFYLLDRPAATNPLAYTIPNEDSSLELAVNAYHGTGSAERVLPDDVKVRIENVNPYGGSSFFLEGDKIKLQNFNEGYAFLEGGYVENCEILVFEHEDVDVEVDDIYIAPGTAYVGEHALFVFEGEREFECSHHYAGIYYESLEEVMRKYEVSRITDEIYKEQSNLVNGAYFEAETQLFLNYPIGHPWDCVYGGEFPNTTGWWECIIGRQPVKVERDWIMADCVPTWKTISSAMARNFISDEQLGRVWPNYDFAEGVANFVKMYSLKRVIDREEELGLDYNQLESLAVDSLTLQMLAEYFPAKATYECGMEINAWNYCEEEEGELAGKETENKIEFKNGERNCGNGICDSGETQKGCCEDCGCPANYACVNNMCKFDCSGTADYSKLNGSALAGLLVDVALDKELNTEGWEVYGRFFRILRNVSDWWFEEVPEPDKYEKRETLFVASLSLALDMDLRDKFREWDFPIDDVYFEEIFSSGNFKRCDKKEKRYFTCPDGEKVEWCSCRDGKWNCIKSPEALCEEYSFIHPNSFLNDMEIEEILDLIPLQPWREDAYNEFMEFNDNTLMDENTHSPGKFWMKTNSPEYGGTCEDIIIGGRLGWFDGTAAQNLALAYKLTGEEKYANKAIEFLNAWAEDSPTTVGGDGYLHAWWSLFAMWNAADLLYDYPNWQEEDRERFKDWVRYMVEQHRYQDYKHWGTSRLAYLITAAQFLEDPKLFNYASDTFKKMLPHLIDSNGSFPREAVRREKGLWYHQMPVSAMTMTAEVARHNGIDLYNYTTEDGKGLKLAADYLVYYLLHKDEWPHWPYVWSAFSMSAPYEMLYSQWQEADYREFLEVARPFSSNSYYYPYGPLTLTHAWKDEQPYCGDRYCTGEENQDNCCEDCGCPSGLYCIEGVCSEVVCGDGVCEGPENYKGCCEDCGCVPENFICTETGCVPPE